MVKIEVRSADGKHQPADKVKVFHETPQSAEAEARAWAFYGWKVEVKKL